MAQFQQLHKDLSRCAAVSEPGTLAKADGVYLALVCFEGSFLGLLGVRNRVVLLKCTRPCRPSEPGAWSYVGTLLTEADAKSLSMRKFSATDLYSGGDHDFLIVSPVGTLPGEGAYKGCAVFLFHSLDRGQIARDEKGQPRLHNYVQFGPESFNGACTVVPDGPHAGVIMGEVEFARRAGSGIEPKFHIYGTGQRP